MRWLTSFIFMVAFMSPGILFSQDEPAEKEDSPFTTICQGNVEVASPLWGSWILYARSSTEDGHNGLNLHNVYTGETYPWYHDWFPENDGWAGYAAHPVLNITASPNGQWVAFMLGVNLPEELVPEQYPGMSSCEVILLSQADGTHARAVALSILVGGGPYFDFTTDGHCLIGTPFLECIPDAEHYAEFLNRNPDQDPDYRFNEYCVSTGARKLIADLEISDGYWKCPYSDNFRIENNWYDEHRFSNFKTGGVLGEYTIPGENPNGHLQDWVLRDAVLISSTNGCGLLYVDGTYVPAPDGDWEVYCWLPDGTYLFSDDAGATVKHGKVDWTTFSIDWWVEHPELVDLRSNIIMPLHDASGVLIHDWGSGRLLHLPLSRTEDLT